MTNAKLARLNADALADLRADLAFSEREAREDASKSTPEWEAYRADLRTKIARAESGESAHRIALAWPAGAAE